MKYVAWGLGVVLAALAALLMFVNIPTQLYLLERNLFADSGLSSSAAVPIVALLAPGLVLVVTVLLGALRRWPLPRTIFVALACLLLVNLLALPSSLIGSII